MAETVAHLTFGQDGTAAPFLLTGWSAGERGFRWMIGARSEFWLDNPGPGTYVMTIDLHPLVDANQHPEQRISFEIGGLEAYSAVINRLTRCEVPLPAAALPGGRRNSNVIHHPDAITPVALGRGTDKRQLAFAVREVRLDRVGPAVEDGPTETPTAPPEPQAREPLAPEPQAPDPQAPDPQAPAVVTQPRRFSTVFVGNCQMNALSNLYRRLLPPGDEQDIGYVASYVDATPDALRMVANADQVVQQVLDFVPRIGDLTTKAKVVLVPHISAAFLWPHGGMPHPRNQSEPLIERSGPYNTELGDTFLNRLIAAGTEPAAALAEYLAAETAVARRAERMMELHLQKQHDRDTLCGIQAGEYIEANFRARCLFRSTNHPVPELMTWVAAQVFANMGLDRTTIDRMVAEQPNMLPVTETPIHPAVASHFDLAWAPPNRRYIFFHEGSFTFPEYVVRYMRYDWNRPLAEGLELLRQNETAAGIAKLEQALPTAPYAGIARIMMADALARVGRLRDAVEYACQAIEIEPGNEHFNRRLFALSDRLRAETARAALAG